MLVRSRSRSRISDSEPVWDREVARPFPVPSRIRKEDLARSRGWRASQQPREWTLSATATRSTYEGGSMNMSQQEGHPER